MMIPNGIMTDGRCNKIAGDQHRTLVDQLVKRMLAIGAGFAPDNRPRTVPHLFSPAVNAFTIAFHIALLKVGGKAMHILVVRQYSLRLSIEEAGVPKPYKPHNDRDIFFERCMAEMVVG